MVSPVADALALEAAVARVTPPTPEAVVVGGLLRMEIREGRALTFSFSLIEAVLVVLVTRRVYTGRLSPLFQKLDKTLTGMLEDIFPRLDVYSREREPRLYQHHVWYK